MQKTVILALVLLVVVTACAGAATLEYKYSIGSQLTNWSDTLAVSKFDSTLGALQSIEFLLTGRVDGFARFESTNNGPSTVVMNLSADMRLMRDKDTLLAIVTPLYSKSDTVTGFDGTVDWGGTSGRSYDELYCVDKVSCMINSPSTADLAFFTANGAGHSVMLPIVAAATSKHVGPGNVSTWFNTNAAAEVTVRYNYAAVPEPSSIALALSGVSAMLGGFRLRKR